MLIHELYDALDDLEAQAQSNAEIFAEDGDLPALATRLSQIGYRAYNLSSAVNAASNSLKEALG